MRGSSDRVLAVDAYRGLVMLLLLPDLEGGFSFYQMGERFPEDPLWTTLGRLFTHAQWSGFTVWDLIQPSFALLIGVAMPLSASARQARGYTRAQIVVHVVLRSLALFLLALLLRNSFRTLVDELWPFLLLASGLTLHPRLANRLGIRTEAARRRAELAWSVVVLAATAAWLCVNLEELGSYDFTTILSQLALAIPFAFLLVGRGVRVQIATALALLLCCFALYALYPLPGPAFDSATVGVAATDEWYDGFFAHWNKNANVGHAFDVWLLNLLPRVDAFEFNEHGLTTLNFVPTIATMIFGVMGGELLRSGRPRAAIRNVLLTMGIIGIATGLAAALWVCPLVKSLWTPSWTLFSAGVTTLVLALLYELCDVRNARALAVPLAVLGTNSILLYTLSSNYRWWFLGLPTKLFGIDIGGGPYGPVAESVAFMAMLAMIAFVLYRLKIFVRL